MRLKPFFYSAASVAVPLLIVSSALLLSAAGTRVYAQDSTQVQQTSNAPTPLPPTATNAVQVKPIARLGRGVIEQAIYSPDGKTLAVASSVGIWLYPLSALDAEPRLTESPTDIASVAFSPDGRTIASGSFDKTVRLWDIAIGQTIATLSGHTDVVTSVAFSPDGRTLASRSDDGTLRLWNVASGKTIATLSGHTKGVSSVAFSPDGRTLASGSFDGTVRLWDTSVLP